MKQAARIDDADGFAAADLLAWQDAATDFLEARSGWPFARADVVDRWPAQTLVDLSATQFAGGLVEPSSIADLQFRCADADGRDVAVDDGAWRVDWSGPHPRVAFDALWPAAGQLPLVATYRFDPLPNLTRRAEAEHAFALAVRAQFEQRFGGPGAADHATAAAYGAALALALPFAETAGVYRT